MTNYYKQIENKMTKIERSLNDYCSLIFEQIENGAGTRHYLNVEQTKQFKKGVRGTSLEQSMMIKFFKIENKIECLIRFYFIDEYLFRKTNGVYIVDVCTKRLDKSFKLFETPCGTKYYARSLEHHIQTLFENDENNFNKYFDELDENLIIELFENEQKDSLNLYIETF